MATATQDRPVTALVCALAELLPDECSPGIDRHHVFPISAGGDPDGPTVPVCDRHHPILESMARRVLGGPRRCPHPPGTHRYPDGREACERRLNAVASNRRIG